MDSENSFIFGEKKSKFVNLYEAKFFLNNLPNNVIPSINRTVGILNINRLHLLDQWSTQYKSTRLNDPIELIDHLVSIGPTTLNNINLKLKEYSKMASYNDAFCSLFKSLNASKNDL